MLSSAAMGKSGLAPALKDPYGTCGLLQLVKWVQSKLWWRRKQDEAGFIDCDTSIPSVSRGMHSFPYIPCVFVCLQLAHLREKVHRRKLQNQNEPFGGKEKVRRKSAGAFAAGFLSINLSADYPGTEELNVMQIHL